ncbi:MAG: hypothetical protein AAF604_07145 [Acidobacteriota bacterium]
MREEQQRKVLVGLLVFLVLVVAWRYGGGWLSGSGGPRPLDFSSGLEEITGADRIATLSIEELTAEARDYSPGRDPFRYYDPPPPPPPPRPAIERPTTPVRRPEPRVVDTSPRPPAIPYQFLGSFGPSGRKIAVLAEGDEIINALEGDVLEQQFVIDAIGLESVDIKYIDFPDEPAKRLAAGAETTFGR